VKSHASLGIHGRLSVTAVDAEWFHAHRDRTDLMMNPPASVVSDRHEGDNTICVNGVSAIAAAIVWSGLQDQAANLGVTSTYLTPLYGAVGSGTGSVANTDTQLFTELGRQTVGAGAASPATTSISGQFTWLFYFAQPTSTWTVTEAGVFANASATANSGILMDHYVVSPSVTVTTSNTLILQAVFSLTGV
jgi:hypothetical protein